MKIFTRSLLTIILFASTLLFATGVGESTIITEDKMNEAMLNTVDASDIIDLSASTINGLSICNFRIKSLADTKAGILYMSDAVTRVEVNQDLTQAEANGLLFDPKEGFIGEIGFTYSGININGDEGSVATVTLPIIAGGSQGGSESDSSGDSESGSESGSENNTTNPSLDTDSVTTDDKINPEMLNSLPAVDILNLSGKDANGEVVNNFIINSLPKEEAGTLYMADGTTVVVGEQNLSRDESDGLKFDPKEAFIGDAQFRYQSVDVNGELGNVATVTIPVVGTLTPDKNGSKKDCTCDDYNESISVLSSFGIFLMMILTSLIGILLMRKEI